MEVSWREWSEDSLPQAVGPEEDLGDAARQLDEFGYVVLRNHLSTKTVDKLRQRIVEQAEGERLSNVANLIGPADSIARWLGQIGQNEVGAPGGGQFVTGLLAKGDVFQIPLLDEKVGKLVAHVVGSQQRLSAYMASLVIPGSKLMGLHTDQWYMTELQKRNEPTREKSGDVSRSKPAEQLDDEPDRLITPAYSVNTIWMLSDFSERNGATRIVPKSHLSGIVPEGVVPHRHNTIPVEGPAGSVLVYDARLWHSAGERHGDETRYALHATFNAPIIRPATNFFLSYSPALLESMPERILELLAYKAWLGYGTTSDLMAGQVDFNFGQNAGFMSPAYPHPS